MGKGFGKSNKKLTKKPSKKLKPSRGELWLDLPQGVMMLKIICARGLLHYQSRESHLETDVARKR